MWSTSDIKSLYIILSFNPIVSIIEKWKFLIIPSYLFLFWVQLFKFELILGVLFPHVDYFFIRRHEAKKLAEKEKEEVDIADEQ